MEMAGCLNPYSGSASAGAFSKLLSSVSICTFSINRSLWSGKDAAILAYSRSCSRISSISFRIFRSSA